MPLVEVVCVIIGDDVILTMCDDPVQEKSMLENMTTVT